MAAIVEAWWSLEVYNVYWELLNTREHGIPQNRPRYFLVGILKAVDLGFQFPRPLEQVPLERVLDPRMQRPCFNDLPIQAATEANVLRFLERFIAAGHDPFSEACVFDIDASANWGTAMVNCCPCFIRSRSKGYWVSNRGRRLRLPEAMRLQGIDCASFPLVVSEVQVWHQLGNSMSVNVLERLLVQLLFAAQLSGGAILQDRYAP